MGRRPKQFFRRESFLVCYWQGDQLVFENYSTGIRLTADPLTCQLLHFFSRWRSLEELAAHLTQYSPISLRSAVATLERYSLLRSSVRRVDRRTRALDTWSSWNPSAGFFHLSTKDVAYTGDLLRAAQHLRRRVKYILPPAPIKRYSNVSKIKLPRANLTAAFPRTLLARRTWRNFSRRAISVAELSTLLNLTWGVQGWLDGPGSGRMALKTSPSAGARHPIEVYVLAVRVGDVPRGLYHYAADDHRLELIKAGASGRQILAYLPTQWWFTKSAALMIMTAVFPRTQWRYQFARAYRTVLAEVGHFCQTFCLTATWLGLAPFCTMALNDSRIERDLGIDGVTESVLYVAGVGQRPVGSRWIPPNVSVGKLLTPKQQELFELPGRIVLRGRR